MFEVYQPMSSWKHHFTESLAETLRFLVRGSLLLNAILLALGSIYVTAKFVWHAVRWIDRVAYSHPW